jgi:hypothetical protein
MDRRFLVGLILLAAVSSPAQQFVITNAIVSSDVVVLDWTSPTDRYIVAQSSDLMTGTFQYVGSVLPTNHASVTNSDLSAFFRIRKVALNEFSDPFLRQAVLQAIPTKYAPTNQIYDIDLQGITELIATNTRSIADASGLRWLQDLTNLDICVNQLTNLDVSGFTSLQTLQCYDNQLTSLNVSGCTSLWALVCFDNQLMDLDVSSCSNLRNFDCSSNHLTSLNLSGYINLQYLWCFDNPLTNLDVSGCANLFFWDCHNAQLASLNVPGLTSLEHLRCYGNQLTNLDVSGVTNLFHLWCGQNQLTNLDVSTCSNLQVLLCESNQLTNLDVSGALRIGIIYCIDNQLTDLSSLVTNALRGGLGTGDAVILNGNPLSSFAKTNQIPVLESYGVEVEFDP